MEKDFVPYELAVKLKEIGFDEPCFGRWWFRADMHKLNEEELEIIRSNYFELPEHSILAPTFSQAFRWFRKKYGLLHDITLTLNVNDELIGFYILIHKLNGLAINENDSVELNVKTIDKEEAELACLSKLIEIVETRTK